MSGSLGSLSAAEITDIRRFCGYPPRPMATVTANDLAGALGALAASSPTFPLTTQQIGGVLTALGIPGVPVSADPCSLAIMGLSDEELDVIRSVYLANLTLLEADIPGARVTLNVAKAAAFTRNPEEMRERRALFLDWRVRLCQFMGIPTGPYLASMVPAVFVV